MNIDWQHHRQDPLHPVDDAFPVGRMVIDEAAVANAVRTAGGALGPVGGMDDTGSGRLRDVHYYPGRMLRAVHQIADGRVVAVDAVPAGTALIPGPGQVALPELRALGRPFPQDPGLPALPALLREAGPAAEVFTWLPGRRAVIADDHRVARLDMAVDVTAAHRRHLALSGAVRGVTVPTPIALDAERGVRWETRVSGTPVEQGLDGMPAETLATMVCQAISGLHRCLPAMDPALLADRGSAPLLTRLRRKTGRTVGRALPGLAPRFDALVAALERTRPEPGPAVLVHGDLHIANTLLDDSGLLLLDIDEMGYGEPELDLAMFAGRMLLVAAHHGAGMADAARFSALLPEVYADTAQRTINSATYTWYLAAVLAARQVKTSIRHLAPDLEPLCDGLVSLAEQILAGQWGDAALAPAA